MVQLRQRVLAGDDLGSVAAAEQLAAAAEVDIPTAVAVHEDWSHQHDARGALLPRPEDYGIDENRRHYAQLRAGVFYISHGDPERALAALELVPAYTRRAGRTPSACGRWPTRPSARTPRSSRCSRTPSPTPPARTSPPSRRATPASCGGSAATRTPTPFWLASTGPRGCPTCSTSARCNAERLGELDAAEDDLRAYIRLRPDSADGYNALGYMFADHGVRLEEARVLIEDALAIDPESAAIVDSYGWVLYRLGDLPGARAQLEQSLRLMGREPHVEILAHYGEVLWEMGLEDDAVRVWRKGWELDDGNDVLLETMRRYDLESGAKLY